MVALRGGASGDGAAMNLTEAQQSVFSIDSSFNVFFICQNTMPFEELVDLARQKHVGNDDYWLAVALQRVRQVSLLPRMIKPIDLSTMQSFFLEEAAKLMNEIDN